MRPSRAVPAGISICLAALLTVPGNGLAQGVPGYRMRPPVGGPFGGHVGVPVRPPRLRATPDDVPGAPGAPFRRRLLPYDNFGWYFVGSDGADYPDDSTRGYTTEAETQPEREVYPVYDSEPNVGPLELSSRQVGSRTILRLTWRDDGLGATQVAFFLADTRRAVLSAQTVRTPPFTAQFEPPAGTAFAGMTVVLRGGTLVTRYVPWSAH